MKKIMEITFIPNETEEDLFVRNVFNTVFNSRVDSLRVVETIFKKGLLNALTNSNFTLIFSKTAQFPCDFYLQAKSFIALSLAKSTNGANVQTEDPFLCCLKHKDIDLEIQLETLRTEKQALYRNMMFGDFFNEIADVINQTFDSFPDTNIINEKRIAEMIKILEGLDCNEDYFVFNSHSFFINNKSDNFISTSLDESLYKHQTNAYKLLASPSTTVPTDITNIMKPMNTSFTINQNPHFPSVVNAVLKSHLKIDVKETLSLLYKIQKSYGNLYDIIKENDLNSLKKITNLFESFHLNKFLLEEQKKLADKINVFPKQINKNPKQFVKAVFESKLHSDSPRNLGSEISTEMHINKKLKINFEKNDPHNKNLHVHVFIGNYSGDNNPMARLLWYDTDFLKTCIKMLGKDFMFIQSCEDRDVLSKYITSEEKLKNSSSLSYELSDFFVKIDHPQWQDDHFFNNKMLAFMYKKACIEGSSEITSVESLVKDLKNHKPNTALEISQQSNEINETNVENKKYRKKICDILAEINKTIRSNEKSFERNYKSIDKSPGDAVSFLETNELLKLTVQSMKNPNISFGIRLSFTLSNSIEKCKAVFFKSEIKDLDQAQSYTLSENVSSKEIFDGEAHTIKFLKEFDANAIEQILIQYHDVIKQAIRYKVLYNGFIDKICNKYPEASLQVNANFKSM